jgi:hypothetical protein
MNRKGQQSVSMGFGMIFAIFLIIVFVIVAFIAVKHFLDLGDTAEIGFFYDDLQNAVDKALKEQESDKLFEINLPSGIEMVCFASERITNPGPEYDAIERYEVYNANLFLVPPEKTDNMAWKTIERINISRITEEENPYCVSASGKLRIQKDFYDRRILIQ